MITEVLFEWMGQNLRIVIRRTGPYVRAAQVLQVTLRHGIKRFAAGNKHSDGVGPVHDGRQLSFLVQDHNT